MSLLDERLALGSCGAEPALVSTRERTAAAEDERLRPVKLFKRAVLVSTVNTKGMRNGAREHADLVRDVRPPVRANGGRLELVLEEVVELLAHLDDPEGHLGDVLLPLLEHGRLVQNQ